MKYLNAEETLVSNGNGWSGFIEAPEFKNWLSEGNTPEPADVPPPPTVQDRLTALDATNALTQRNLREALMLMTEAIKLATNNAVDLTTVPGIEKVYSVEAEAATLRAQL